MFVAIGGALRCELHAFARITWHLQLGCWFLQLVAFFFCFFVCAQGYYCFFEIPFANTCFVVPTYLMLGHMGLINRDNYMLVCWLIYLACFACLFGVFIFIINFFLSFQLSCISCHFCRCILAVEVALIRAFPRAQYYNERAGILNNVCACFFFACLRNSIA